MLAAYHCGSKLLILSQNTTSLPVPFPFFEAEGFLPVTIFEGEVPHPSRFSKGGTMAGAPLSAALQGRVSPSK